MAIFPSVQMRCASGITTFMLPQITPHQPSSPVPSLHAVQRKEVKKEDCLSFWSITIRLILFPLMLLLMILSGSMGMMESYALGFPVEIPACSALTAGSWPGDVKVQPKAAPTGVGLWVPFGAIRWQFTQPCRWAGTHLHQTADDPFILFPPLFSILKMRLTLFPSPFLSSEPDIQPGPHL